MSNNHMSVMPSYEIRLPGRIVFGRGTAHLALSEMGERPLRILLVASRSSAFATLAVDRLRTDGHSVEVVHGQGEPDIGAVEDTVAVCREFRPDRIVSIGGGSVIDLGKAVAALAPQPEQALKYLEVVGDGAPLAADPLGFIAMPTTAGTGAEVTKNAVIGVPEQGRKVSLRDTRMLPDNAVVDPALTDGCPRAITLASGLDAIVQVIEPFLSARATPITDAICRDAIPRGLAAIKALMVGEDPDARDQMAHVSLCGGIALANAGLGAVHGLAGVIGGRTGMAHGAICGRLLVPVLEANEAALTAANHPHLARIGVLRRMIAEALGTAEATAFTELLAWIGRQGLPRLPSPTDATGPLTEWARDAQVSSSMKANPVVLPLDVLETILQTTFVHSRESGRLLHPNPHSGSGTSGHPR